MNCPGMSFDHTIREHCFPYVHEFAVNRSKLQMITGLKVSVFFFLSEQATIYLAAQLPQDVLSYIKLD